ncbi:hypothetical protein FB192DRAFT_1445241 [Mucor lusitanicus]|uniref:Uncharacterized protein n=2 Tax=Mucor circinelloides f. lusitanicus TaxID=29924 RepID=A0A168Q6L6_MUCCL|nr:hypothetical protein FB192DRAFT_1445241 [Mucor lusitanicus]OAD08774.1 hypothetical protein MUCCIDRAFT_105740 [Mucor lusitanicus CBS 277.49]
MLHMLNMQMTKLSPTQAQGKGKEIAVPEEDVFIQEKLEEPVLGEAGPSNFTTKKVRGRPKGKKFKPVAGIDEPGKYNRWDAVDVESKDLLSSEEPLIHFFFGNGVAVSENILALLIPVLMAKMARPRTASSTGAFSTSSSKEWIISRMLKGSQK